MARSHAGAGVAVAEVPGIGQGVAVGVGRAAAVEAHGRALGARVRAAHCCGGRAIRRSADRHGELSRARSTVFVGDRHAHSVRAGQGIGVRRRDRVRLARRAPGSRGQAVTPGNRVRPGSVVRPGITKGGAHGDRAADRRRLIGSPRHRGRDVRDRGRGGGRCARCPVCIGDGERDGVAAVIGVHVARVHAGATRPVAEAPGVGERVAVRIRRPAAVEAHRPGLRPRVRSAGSGGGGVIHGRWGRRRVVAGAAPRVGERLAGDRDKLPIEAAGAERQFEDAEGDVVAHLGIRRDRPEGEQPLAAPGPDDDFADAVGRIQRTRRGLGREPLIVVVMAVEHELDSGVVQRAPQRS